MDKSYPSVICEANFSEYILYCLIKEAFVEIKLKKKVEENTILKVTLIGVKNPEFIGETTLSFFTIEAQHASGFLINQGDFNSLDFQNPLNKGTMFFSTKLSSYY